MYAITIDAGTTNTRVSLWSDGTVIQQAFHPAGVRDTAITGSTDTLKRAVRTAIREVLDAAGIQNTQGITFLASGMITSNVGLVEIPHIAAPAGLQELAAGMVQHSLPDVIDEPIWFVPGVKNHVTEVTLETCETMDVIRGEEVEVIGVLETLKLRGPAVLVLPGSHSKMISIDDHNRITGCVTTIAGELLDVITKNTILANALNNSFATEIEESVLLQGAEYVNKTGLARTCFTVRILDMFSGMSLNQKANFLLGAVLGADMLALKNSDALHFHPSDPIVIHGKKLMKDALAALIRQDPYFTGELHIAGDHVAGVAGSGALAIARARGILG